MDRVQWNCAANMLGWELASLPRRHERQCNQKRSRCSKKIWICSLVTIHKSKLFLASTDTACYLPNSLWCLIHSQFTPFLKAPWYDGKIRPWFHPGHHCKSNFQESRWLLPPKLLSKLLALAPYLHWHSLSCKPHFAPKPSEIPSLK